MKQTLYPCNSCFRFVVLLGVLIFLLSGCTSEVFDTDISLVVYDQNSAPTNHGTAQILLALKYKGIVAEQVNTLEEAKGNILIIVSIAQEQNEMTQLLFDADVQLSEEAEALVIQRTRWNGKMAYLITGSDERGVMYAALDVADRIRWSNNPANPFQHIRNTQEKPDHIERSLSFTTFHRGYFEQRLFNEDYWEKYFGMMAQNRLNSLLVIFRYENDGFMAPLYPYFYDLDEFSNVQMVDITPQEQQRNREALRRIIEIAHNHGVDFIVGIWDHIYRGGLSQDPLGAFGDKAPEEQIPGRVLGITSDNLAVYSKAAIAAFIEYFPDIDGIQFRMHGESGLQRSEMEGFWHDVFQIIKMERPDLRVDIRAKGLTDAIIDDGLQQQVNLRVTTKYWMEQMGLPFHPTHINPYNQFDRRHGYADMLRYPQKYRIHWRMWTEGSNRILLWGNPEYARRFAESAHFYNGNSFEVNDLLVAKMHAQPHDREPFELLNPQYKYYEWEFERYWHFYQVFGRLGYNPETPPEIWEREFDRRYGKEAGPYIMKGLHLASNVLPRIVAASYRYFNFPTTRGWPELMRIYDLPIYATAEGSDVQQFVDFREEAVNVLRGFDTAQRRPSETASWFSHTADSILENVAEAERLTGRERSNEFISTVTDLKILAYLALYHARRIPAAVSFNLYKQTQDLFALDDAIRHETNAMEAWQKIVESAGDVYAEDLMFGVRAVGLSGHWRDELVRLRDGIEDLKRERATFAPDFGDKRVLIAHVPLRRIAPHEDLQVRSTVYSQDKVSYCAFSLQK